jgi:flagellar biosynthesis chaperone FliJ
MEKNDEITLSEAKKITGELKASILKLESLNTQVVSNISQLEELNQKMKDYTSVLSRFEFKDEKEMSLNYASYLSFIGKKIDELSKSSSLKKLEFIVDNSNKIVKFATLKLGLIAAIGVIVLQALSMYKT